MDRLTSDADVSLPWQNMPDAVNPKDGRSFVFD